MQLGNWGVGGDEAGPEHPRPGLGVLSFPRVIEGHCVGEERVQGQIPVSSLDRQLLSPSRCWLRVRFLATHSLLRQTSWGGIRDANLSRALQATRRLVGDEEQLAKAFELGIDRVWC